MKTETTTIKKDALRDSLKHNLMPPAIADALTISLTYIIVQTVAFIADIWEKNLALPDNLLDVAEKDIPNVLATIESYYRQFLLLSIGGILAIVLVFIISRAIIYRMQTKSKFDIKKTLKAIPLGIIWIAITTAFFILIAKTVRQEYIEFVVILCAIFTAYKTQILFLTLAETEKFFPLKELKANLFNKKLMVGFSLVFILFCIILIIIGSAVTLSLRMIGNPFVVPIGFYVTIIFSLFYLAWSRFYLIEKKRG